MNKTILCLSAVCIFISSPQVYAQNDTGNGGKVWVCYKPTDPKTGKREIDYVELLDYVEARTITTWNINLGEDRPQVDDTDTMIEVALARLSHLDRWRANKLREKVAEMKNSNLTKRLDYEKERAALNEITDANILVSTPPEDQTCVEKQGAFNKVKPGPHQFKYVFIKQYLEKMNDMHRAGIYLHEAMYNLEASLKAKDSDGAREQVRAMSSTNFSDEFTQETYYAFAKENSMLPTVSDEYLTYTDVGFDKKGRIIWSEAVEAGHYPYFALEQISPITAPSTDSYRLFALPINIQKGERLRFHYVHNPLTGIELPGLSAGSDGSIETKVHKSINIKDIRGYTDTGLIVVEDHTQEYHHMKTDALMTLGYGVPEPYKLLLNYPALTPVRPIQLPLCELFKYKIQFNFVNGAKANLITTPLDHYVWFNYDSSRHVDNIKIDFNESGLPKTIELNKTTAGKMTIGYENINSTWQYFTLKRNRKLLMEFSPSGELIHAEIIRIKN